MHQEFGHGSRHKFRTAMDKMYIVNRLLCFEDLGFWMTPLPFLGLSSKFN